MKKLEINFVFCVCAYLDRDSLTEQIYPLSYYMIVMRFAMFLLPLSDDAENIKKSKPN